MKDDLEFARNKKVGIFKRELNLALLKILLLLLLLPQFVQIVS